MTTPFVETIPADENARFEGFAAEIRAMQKHRANGGALERGLHVKAHVGVVGTLTVGELAPHLRVGPFASPTTWPLYARFSNGTGARQHDGVRDVRGLALKLVGVPGKKVIPGLEDKATQDFLLIQSSTLPVRTPDEFMVLLRAAAKGGPLLLPRLVAGLGLSRTLKVVKALASQAKVTSLATIPFYTAAPMRFGDTAAKLRLVPTSTTVTPPSTARDALRDDLIARLSQRALSYRLEVQLYVDETQTPVEDASVPWLESISPFVPLATLTLHKQAVTSSAGQEIEKLVEAFSFDPWHAVEALKPVGAVMRARSSAYRESTIARGAAAEPDTVLSST